MARRIRPAAWVVVPAGFLFMACLLLWFGMAIVVRCERVAGRAGGGLPAATESGRPGCVDVIVDYRVPGLVPVRRVNLVDVEKADAYADGARGARGWVLQLNPRDQRAWESPRVRFTIGTPPRETAARINAFIAASTPPTLVLWWSSWLLNLLALPLVLVTLLFAAVGLRWLLRTVGIGHPARRPPAS